MDPCMYICTCCRLLGRIPRERHTLISMHLANVRATLPLSSSPRSCQRSALTQRPRMTLWPSCRRSQAGNRTFFRRSCPIFRPNSKSTACAACHRMPAAPQAHSTSTRSLRRAMDRPRCKRARVHLSVCVYQIETRVVIPLPG